MSDNFCPAPWIGLFYTVNSAGVCCVDSIMSKTSPDDLKNTDHVKTLKKEFLAGKRPTSCGQCWKNELIGLQSIRMHTIKRMTEYADISKFSVDTDIDIKHLELRASNLCNFKCRMCNGNNSIEIQREIENNTKLRKHFEQADSHITEISDSNWESIKQISLGLESLVLTGGEPFLIKKYYDLMDHLIEYERIQNITLMIYTNCSVYNPKFINQMIQFKDVVLNLSIDAVGKTAEYQRHGTVWDVVSNNVFKLIRLPVKVFIHSTITAYSILDFSKLSDFYIELYNINNKIGFKAHTINDLSALSIRSIPDNLKEKANEEIELSLNKLQDKKFSAIRRELESIQKHLRHKTSDSSKFVEFTNDLDLIRNENFQNTFNLRLTDQ